MKLANYIFEQALRQLSLPVHSIDQFRLASALSDVEGNGFPRELFQLSAPMAVRGLLNFAVFQMNRDWLYPYWVERQLDPDDESYIPRAQNPFFLNVTHRNWTAIGTLHGKHEAIVDPRGLLTPLPRLWSIDCWALLVDEILFPSRASAVRQESDNRLPLVRTIAENGRVRLSVEHFSSTIRNNIDIVFSNCVLKNITEIPLDASIIISVRPFDPEGMSPIFSVGLRNERIIDVNGTTGIVFAEPPDWVHCSSFTGGDIAERGKCTGLKFLAIDGAASSTCERGLAHASAAFRCTLRPGEARSVQFSVALEEEKKLRRLPAKPSWRVSFDNRLEKESALWMHERASGAQFMLPDRRLQDIFDFSRQSLLQFHDGDFITPGPYLYHHFWYRDAALMVRALDQLGFHRRARQIIDAFPKRQMADGYFKGPDGEWDSNGAVLWTIRQHVALDPSQSWLGNWYPSAARATRWIMRKRRKSKNGLLPPSLSAEHLGTVDQYYWDSFWGLAGIASMADIATILNKKKDAKEFTAEFEKFSRDIRTAVEKGSERIGESLIPATPTRMFDESAIGSVSAIYPLQLWDVLRDHSALTVERLAERFVTSRGFFHPFIHSGYNPYLTLQIAHSFLLMGKIDAAWNAARTIFDHMIPPYSLPEAIHPRTFGGVMGDGHHGWASAEIVLFIRDCMVLERNESLVLFEGMAPMYVEGAEIRLENVPTSFGAISILLHPESEKRGSVEFEVHGAANKELKSIELVLPFITEKERSLQPHQIYERSVVGGSTRLRCSPGLRRLFYER